MRRESKQRRMREKAASRGLSARFLEPDQDDVCVYSLSILVCTLFIGTLRSCLCQI